MKNKIIDKIQKLLARSKDNPYEGEALSAIQLANKLMKEHNLTLSEVEVKKALDNDIEKTYSEAKGRFMYWEKILAFSIISLLFDVQVIVNSCGHRQKNFLFVGYKDDAKVAKTVYQELRIYIKLLGIKRTNNRDSRASYYQGLINRLVERVKEEKDFYQIDESKCKDLVIAKDIRIKKYCADNLKLRDYSLKNNTRVYFDEDAYMCGKEDANKIDLQNKRKIKG